MWRRADSAKTISLHHHIVGGDLIIFKLFYILSVMLRNTVAISVLLWVKKIQIDEVKVSKKTLSGILESPFQYHLSHHCHHLYFCMSHFLQTLKCTLIHLEAETVLAPNHIWWIWNLFSYSIQRNGCKCLKFKLMRLTSYVNLKSLVKRALQYFDHFKIDFDQYIQDIFKNREQTEFILLYLLTSEKQLLLTESNNYQQQANWLSK